MDLNVVRNIRIVATTEGADTAAASLNKVAAGNDNVAVSADRVTKSTLSQEANVKRLSMALDPAYRSATLMADAQRKLNLAQEQGLVSLQRQGELLSLAETKYRANSGGIMSMVGDLRGLAAGLGAFAAFDAIMKIHTAIDAVVQSSSGLVHAADTIGMTTKSLQELQFAGAQFQLSTETMDTALEKFSKNLGMAQQGQGELAKILKANHVTISGDVLTDFKNYANLVQNATDAEQKNLLVTAAFGKSAAEMGAIFDHGAAGVGNFVDQADRMGAVVSDEKLRQIDELNKKWSEFGRVLDTDVKNVVIELVLWFAKLQDGVTALLNIPIVSQALVAAGKSVINAIPGYGAAIAAWQLGSQLGTPPTVNPSASAGSMLSDQQAARIKAQAELVQKLTGRGPPGTAGQDGVYDPNFQFNKPTVLPPAAATHDAFESSFKSAEKARDALQAQIEVYRTGVGAVAAFTKQQELLNIAAENGIKLSPTQIAEVKKLADAYGAATQKLAEMKALSDIQFQRQTMFMSPGEAGIASSMRGIYGENWQSQMNGAIATQMRLNEQLKIAGQLASQFASTFVNDLKQGKSFADALKDSFANLADQLLKMALDAAIQNLLRQLAGGIGGGGGWVGAVAGAIGHAFGFEQGGIVGAGGTPRYVHPAYFDDAPHYGSGGLVGGALAGFGLGAGEVPIIAHLGEEILRRDDPRHRANSGGLLGGITIGGAQIIVQGDASENTLGLIKRALADHNKDMSAAVREAISTNNATQARLRMLSE